jgi:16S rRNA (guanine966-N2)-methyltransferase
MRITGGVHRSRILRAPRGDRTRPTSDRVREAVFAILGARRSFEGSSVLDLYSGTGALALEALSRGAARATLVESAKSALQAIVANVEALDLRGRVRIVASSVERATRAITEEAPYDLVLADPPYALVSTGEVSRTLEALATRSAGLFTDGALLVLEHASADGPPTMATFALSDSRRYGDTAVSLYSRESA